MASALGFVGKLVSCVRVQSRQCRKFEENTDGFQGRELGGFRFCPDSDYEAMLAYLRSELGPAMRVVDALIGVAVTGPIGRLR
jgi:hypothetical protein